MRHRISIDGVVGLLFRIGKHRNINAETMAVSGQLCGGMQTGWTKRLNLRPAPAGFLGAPPLNRPFCILFGATAKKYAAGGNQQSVNPARYKRRQSKYFKTARSATGKKYAVTTNRLTRGRRRWTSLFIMILPYFLYFF